MATVNLVALFRTDDDVVERTHSVDVTDCKSELIASGIPEYVVDEELIERTGEKLGWANEPNFIQWQQANIAS